MNEKWVKKMIEKDTCNVFVDTYKDYITTRKYLENKGWIIVNTSITDIVSIFNKDNIIHTASVEYKKPNGKKFYLIHNNSYWNN